MQQTTDDVRIQHLKELVAPQALLDELPLSPEATKQILAARQAATNIIQGRDDRLMVVVGPCSIHDLKSALEYAEKLKALVSSHQKELLIIMRVYFEKPRTSIGWKGLINDPHLDSSFDINRGLKTARTLLVNLAERGLPAGTEFLDTITPQYFSDLITWGAIGARTTESQVHRELASGLSMPIGFKNSTDGNIKNAIDAIKAANHPHHFLSVTKKGHTAIVNTRGNPDGHIILRGSSTSTNYDEKSVINTAKSLDKNKLNPKLMVDCSHGNSQKDHTRQHLVTQAVCQQIASGSRLIMGVMIESHLNAGNQALIPGNPLKYGISITDACIDFEETKKILAELAQSVKTRRQLADDNSQLAQHRHKIDEIDKAIEMLILDRAKQAQQIAQVKKSEQSNATLYRPEREQAVLRKILERNNGPVSDKYMEEIFRQIMSACLDVEK